MIRPVALGLLVGSLLVGCGSRRGVTGSPAATSDDAGASPDASAAADGGSPAPATTTADSGARAEAGATGDAQCTWPADLNPPAGGAGGWSVGRYLLSCPHLSIDAGPVDVCATDDPHACPGDTAGGPLMCINNCEANEYALALGGTTDMPTGPMPPASCRTAVGDAAGGGGYYCCPCGAGDAGAQ